MALKTYVLLDHLKPTAPIYQQLNAQQRARIDTIPQWQPYLQVTFLDERDEVVDYDPDSPTFNKMIKNKWKGKNRTARLKMNSNTPWQDEQIEKEKIPANDKFTQVEYDIRTFRHNVLSTNNLQLQRFLENIPYMEGFKGYCDSISGPSYKLYDENIEIESDNKAFLKRLDAANKIAKLELKEAQDLLIRIYGTFYTLPTTKSAAQNALVGYMDTSDEAVDDILKEETTVDEEVQILVGRLVSNGTLSFEAVEGQVCKKKGNEWIELKAIGSEYTTIERERYFIEFLTSQAGKLLLDDLKKESSKKVKEKELV